MSKTIFIALCFLAATQAHAEGSSMTVATLLPPPVEALKGSTAAMVAVPVLKQPVQKGETISADNITLQEIPSSQAFASTITNADELTGQQAVRPLMAGSPVNRLHVRVAPMVMRNSAVTFVFSKGGIELSGRGQAMEDGQLGQSIRIINSATRSTIIGTITGAGTVQVN